MERNLKQLIAQMTLEEKAGMCSGFDFWRTKSIDRLGIPSMMMSDGPHGLRKQASEADHLGLNESVPAVCFPSGAGLACSWDRELLHEVGTALGEECQAEQVGILLGPAVNIKRSPLCGRNFEYYSEDPYLSSELAVNFISGVQSQGVGTSIKHFAANNQEHRRMSIDTIVDQRTLREIYLPSFEKAVCEGRPWTVMCAYNKLNGEFCSENRTLLTDILQDEWGFDGFVVSDWGAVNDRVKGLSAGLHLEMPSSAGIRDKKIVEAVQSGKLDVMVLDEAVERILKIVYKAYDNQKQGAAYDKEVHHKLAQKAAAESMVLLKNEEELLPLKRGMKIAVSGAFAKMPRYQGGGSSHINPFKLENILDELTRLAGDASTISYAEGYLRDQDDIVQGLIEDAKEKAGVADAAVVFVGLPDRYESEGYDREHMGMPENHVALVREIAKVQKNTIVVLSNGSPVEMPWIDDVKSVLEVYLGGQALGGAIAEILFGDRNPCGKLAESFPLNLKQNPSYINFPGEMDWVEYKEGLFVGYRHYDMTGTKTLFPFGHGLSYTSFEYSDLRVDRKELTDQESVEVSLTVQNVGRHSGKETVQLYVRDVNSSVIRPCKELKGFEKIALSPGEKKQVHFILDRRAFAYYNEQLQDWHVETGDFEILIGQSSAEIQLSQLIHVTSTTELPVEYHLNTLVGDLMEDPEATEFTQSLLTFLTGEGQLCSDMPDNEAMMTAMMKNMPLRAIVGFSQGQYTEDMLLSSLDELNSSKELNTSKELNSFKELNSSNKLNSSNELNWKRGSRS